MTGDQEEFIAEVLRVNQRFVLEVVEAFNLCPYAKGARLAGNSSRKVLLQEDLSVEPTLEFIRMLERESAPPEVVLVVYPCVKTTSREFEHFNARVRDARTAADKTQPLYVHAAFHPDYAFDPRTPDSLVTFFRKTPDPTIQLTHFPTLQSIRGDRSYGTVIIDPECLLRGEIPPPPALSPSQRITRENHAMILRKGPEALEAIFRAIKDDRDKSYARFGRLSKG